MRLAMRKFADLTERDLLALTLSSGVRPYGWTG